ncbi:MAG: O-antigen ligase family protein [Leptolyngbyaceae cyanobacterium]
MAHIDAETQVKDRSAAIWSRILLGCLGLLPYTYVMFVGAFGFLTLCFWQAYHRPKELFNLLYQQGFLVIGVLLVLSSSFAVNRGEAYLQLAHFLPFFWVWAAIALHLKTATNPWQQLYRWAIVLVFATVPINLVGIVEYVLKHQFPEQISTAFPGLYWLYIGDISHPRTFSLFDYPNTLANYLVMILGLNLGLLFLKPRAGLVDALPRWFWGVLYINVPLTLMCLYCSGSRNGYLVAAFLLLVSLFCVRTHRWVRSLGVAGLALIAVTTAQFGIGGRSLSWAWVTDDPRVHVWHLALQLAKERPILGYGLGNYKLLYDGEVPGYDFIAHAHNLWLMLGAEAGIPVMIAFTVFVGLICYRASKALLLLQESPGYYAVLLAFYFCFMSSVLFSLLDVTIFEVRVNLLGWLSLAVLYCSPKLNHISQTD